jgi:hypothetical protein
MTKLEKITEAKIRGIITSGPTPASDIRGHWATFTPEEQKQALEYYGGWTSLCIRAQAEDNFCKYHNI